MDDAMPSKPAAKPDEVKKRKELLDIVRRHHVWQNPLSDEDLESAMAEIKIRVDMAKANGFSEMEVLGGLFAGDIWHNIKGCDCTQCKPRKAMRSECRCDLCLLRDSYLQHESTIRNENVRISPEPSASEGEHDVPPSTSLMPPPSSMPPSSPMSFDSSKIGDEQQYTPNDWGGDAYLL